LPFKLAFDEVPVIITEALAFFVLSVTEMALITTCPPGGPEEGAVKVVLAPLAVDAGLKEPQAEVGVQLQFTPPATVSLVTVAETLAVALAASEAGGGEVRVTKMAGGPSCCVAPPQPEKTTMASKRRTGAFLFMVPPLQHTGI
jgi:hypothetical protein